MRVSKAFVALAFCFCAWQAARGNQQTPVDAARHAYEKGDYSAAIEILKGALANDAGNGEIHLLLTKAYLESKQFDNAVSSGEKAVAANPKNSAYHQWLGEAYGEKADRASMLSAFSWARKTHKEFQTAVELDERNFDAARDLIEYDCTAPSIVGGGQEKVQPLIQKLMELDAAEGHFGAGLCKAVKKDYAAADTEYAKALESKPKTADRLYEIGDYFLLRRQGEKLLEVAAAGESLAPEDPRAKYYRAVGLIVKGESFPEAERLLHEYLGVGSMRSTYPAHWDAHYALGRLYAAQQNTARAKSEYQAALKLNPKYKKAQEALKQLDGQ
jgi:tetratricopeptide (TPR) repeat protein